MYYLNEVIEKFKNIFGDFLGQINVGYRPVRRLVLNSVVSSLFFAAYYVLIKYIYMEQPFVGAFVWSRLGSFLGVLLILFVPDWRRGIIEYQRGQKSPKSMSFFLIVRMLAALAFIMLNWAISLPGASVAIINALQGVQYVFLILIVLFLSQKYPRILKEELGRGVMMQKIIGGALICIGLYIFIC